VFYKKKKILKAFKIRKSPQVSQNVNTPKSLPALVFYTKKQGWANSIEFLSFEFYF